MMGHIKARCWAKGGGLEGQYPEWFKGKRDFAHLKYCENGH